MREFFSLLLGLLALAACTPLEPHEQRILDACGTLEPDLEAVRQDALMGNLDAIDCEIAVADGSYSMRALDPPEAVDSVRWRYLRWIVTGEEPDDLMDLTAHLDQQYLEASLSLIFTHHLEATGQLYAGRYDEAGCFLRPPRMDQLYQRAQPHPDMAVCETAVRAHPFG
ncbi:hypothetical protein OA2633_09379 [Oceanicaulis sp. HTCC2633]|uniref:hypothetical protein n=1 Tax=Oceanicaulis sp. HTCC2633 TaxID=314254 RepID=UPI00006697F1|nr:hypothetical protein [Oceanicaulis sp. HTCC2633]EAP89466.1 hypothetical protein OA2633_09379 [Oceanicaulis sp. HTCC2633]